MNMIKKMPEDATQHRTAGPYSPVLEINCSKLIVISGQAALDQNGNVIGTTIEDQTKKALDNCASQLRHAGCSMEDVFKVTAYFDDLSLWDRFNDVYINYMPKPYPVRTALGTKLLPGLMVEVEMWAAK